MPRGLVQSMHLLLEIFVPHLLCKGIPHCSVQGRRAVLRVCHHPILLLRIIARQVSKAICLHGLISEAMVVLICLSDGVLHTVESFSMLGRVPMDSVHHPTILVVLPDGNS
jgi:hypothetical protein